MLETSIHTPDYHSRLSRAILVELRGSLSQSELSQKLGYSFNQVGKWESGATIFHWNDFTQINEVLGIPWKLHFESVFSFHSGMRVDSTSIFEILSQFFGDASVREMAERLHKSPSSISRLLNDQVKIDFADVLRVMDQRIFVLNNWLSRFLNPQNVELLKNRFEVENHTANNLLSTPWLPIVFSCLSLQEYQELSEHSNHWIAAKTGLSEQQVTKALELLSESGIITKSDSKYRGFVREMTFLKSPQMRELTRYLTSRAAQSFAPKVSKPNFNNPSLSSSLVYPLSSEAGKKAAEALVAFHHQLTEIMKNDKGPKDHVRMVVIHSIDTQLLSAVSENGTPEPHLEKPAFRTSIP